MKKIKIITTFEEHLDERYEVLVQKED